GQTISQEDDTFSFTVSSTVQVELTLKDEDIFEHGKLKLSIWSDEAQSGKTILIDENSQMDETTKYKLTGLDVADDYRLFLTLDNITIHEKKNLETHHGQLIDEFIEQEGMQTIQVEVENEDGDPISDVQVTVYGETVNGLDEFLGSAQSDKDGKVKPLGNQMLS